MGSDKLDTFATATASALRSQLKSSIIPPEKTSHKARNVARALSFSKSSWNSWREIRLAVGEKTFKPLAKSGNQWVSRIIFGDLTKKRGNKLIFNSEAYQTNACTSLISQDGRRNKAKCVCVCVSYQWESWDWSLQKAAFSELEALKICMSASRNMIQRHSI